MAVAVASIAPRAVVAVVGPRDTPKRRATAPRSSLRFQANGKVAIIDPFGTGDCSPSRWLP
jgi:hypothetical protein